jgi:hypothetical protein
MDRRPAWGKLLCALGLIVVSLPLGSGTGAAHPTGVRLLDVNARGMAHAMSQVAPPDASIPAWLLLAVGAALLAGLGTRRLVRGRARARALATVLSLALVVFTFEAALHSVHHLGDPGSGAECPVLAGSHNLAWGAAEAFDTETPPVEVTAAPVARSEDVPRVQFHRPHQGRAPPA